MAGAALPSPTERRQMLAAESPRLAEVGRAFLEAGRWGEALECLAAAGQSEAIADLAALAVEAGDYFYYMGAKRTLGAEPEAKDLKALAEAARRAGLERFAAGAEKYTGPA